MSPDFSNLPPFPPDSQDRLPPPRKNWSRPLGVGAIALVALGLVLLARWLAPGLWVFGLVPGLLSLALAGLAVFGLLGLLLVVYLWQRSEDRER
jgi:hypothetical protein